MIAHIYGQMSNKKPGVDLTPTGKTATEFITSIAGLSIPKREQAFLDALLAGDVPSYMCEFVNVQVSFKDKNGTPHTLTLCTLPDYLTIGSDADRFRVPLWPITAQKVADAWDCILPTTQVVTVLWHAAEAKNKLPPQPWGPPYDASMMSTDRMVRHNARVEATIVKQDADPSRLIVGHKKDVVITNRLLSKPKQVAIFGWHQPNSKPIQPLYLGHENSYSDYAHAIRLLSKVCTLDGVADSLERIMKDPLLCVGVSNEGPMTVIRQQLV